MSGEAAARGRPWPPPAGWDLTPPEALAAYRRFFETVEPALHAFLPEPGRWERLAAAVAAVAAISERPGPAAPSPARGAPSPLRGVPPPHRGVPPPLRGVPIGVKDIFHAAGLPTRAGSRVPADELSPGGAGAVREADEATVVARLRGAGAVVAGKTVTTEFAYFEPGPTENPRARGRTPGGSSSGSAAAVAAGLVPFALGTQTIGSICRPAAFCGVVGFKPSYGRVPRQGLIPLAPSLDHVGMLAADVAWARRVAALLCDDWGEEAAPGAPAARPPGGRPVLAVPAGPYLDHLEPAGREGFEAARRRLAGAGWTVHEVPVMEDFAAIAARHRLLVAAEAAAVHSAIHARHRHLLRPRTLELLDRGRQVAAAEPRAVEAAREGRLELRRRLEARMDEAGIDLWLSPAAPGPPPPGLGATGDPVMNLPWTHAGLPTVALPAPATPDGLPLGVQLTARFRADEILLVWAEPVAAALAAAASARG